MERERAGSQTVRMLADPLNVEILRQMAGGPRLDQMGGRRPERQSDETLDSDPKYGITQSGREALPIRGLLEAWLRRHGGMSVGGDGAREAVEVLAGAWASKLLHTLASGPATAEELRAASSADKAALEADLERMCLFAMVERRRGEHGSALYAVTDWLREGVAPLAAAARHERRHLGPGTARIEPVDVHAAFQLALPLLRLGEECSGTCRLTVEMTKSSSAGVTARFQDGRAIACEPESQEHFDAMATGDVRAWFAAVIDGKVKRVKASGADRHLASAILAALHKRLFGAAGP